MPRRDLDDATLRFGDDDEMDDLGYGRTYSDEDEDEEGWTAPKEGSDLWDEPEDAALEDEEEGLAEREIGDDEEGGEDDVADLFADEAPRRGRKRGAPAAPPAPTPTAPPARAAVTTSATSATPVKRAPEPKKQATPARPAAKKAAKVKKPAAKASGAKKKAPKTTKKAAKKKAAPAKKAAKKKPAKKSASSKARKHK